MNDINVLFYHIIQNKVIGNGILPLVKNDAMMLMHSCNNSLNAFCGFWFTVHVEITLHMQPLTNSCNHFVLFIITK